VTPPPATTDTVAPLRYSPYDYEMHEDPYPTYARLRTEAPLYRNDELDFWALSRHEDVLAAFRSPAQLSNRFGVSLDPSAYGPDAHRAMSFLAMDPPDHTRMRQLVSKAFTPRRVAELEDHVRELARRHVEPAVDRGRFDFVADFAGLLPMDVISEMIGVPESDRAEVRRLADLLVHREEGIFDIPPEGLEAALVLAGYFGDMVTARRARPHPDLTSALMAVDAGEDRLSDDEIISFLFLLVVAGNETTTKLLANAWFWGWHHPHERAKALHDHRRIGDWVEETLRFDTSTQMLLRVTTGEVELLGTKVPGDSRVLLLVGSANRDPACFPDPDRYDLDRDTSKLISFGSGRHFCLGAALARLEARVGLEELLARVSDYDIDEGGAERVHSINVRGFARLPTVVAAR
jgi:cytochrome P450